MIKKTLIFLFICGVSFLTVTPSFALDKASNTVRTTVDEIKRVVEQNKGKLTDKQIDKKLFTVISPLFDFREMSRRSLGAKWKHASESQRLEFVDLFSDLLATNYIKKIRENVEKSSFKVDSEQSTSPKTSVVKTLVDYDGQEATIDYRLRVKKDAWKVYDVIIENIGLVTNYRREFGSIVDKDGISGLIEKLREKK